MAYIKIYPKNIISSKTTQQNTIHFVLQQPINQVPGIKYQTHLQKKHFLIKLQLLFQHNSFRIDNIYSELQ